MVAFVGDKLYTEKTIRNLLDNYYFIECGCADANRFENIICVLVDVNKSISEALTPLEIEIVDAIKRLGSKDAQQQVNMSKASYKYHLQKSCLKISAHLNKTG